MQAALVPGIVKVGAGRHLIATLRRRRLEGRGQRADRSRIRVKGALALEFFLFRRLERSKEGV